MAQPGQDRVAMGAVAVLVAAREKLDQEPGGDQEMAEAEEFPPSLIIM